MPVFVIFDALFKTRFSLWLLSLPVWTIASLIPMVDVSALEESVALNPGPATRIVMVLSVIWEGDHLQDGNLKALAELRKRFPSVPLWHFVEPSYWLKDSTQTKAELISKSIKEQDPVGMHLHGWRSLVKAANVRFRSSPSFWGQRLHPVDCIQDCGRDVPVNVYSTEELARMVAVGKQVLKKASLGSPIGFMAGGWLGSPNVLTAARMHDIRYDFSAIDPAQLQNKLKRYPLFRWIQLTWPKWEDSTIPINISTRAGDLTEIGNAGATIDYHSPASMAERFKAFVAKHRQHIISDKKSEQEPGYFHFGLYQETASRQSLHLAQAIDQIMKFAVQEGVVLEWPNRQQWAKGDL